MIGIDRKTDYSLKRESRYCTIIEWWDNDLGSCKNKLNRNYRTIKKEIKILAKYEQKKKLTLRMSQLEIWKKIKWDKERKVDWQVDWLVVCLFGIMACQPLLGYFIPKSDIVSNYIQYQNISLLSFKTGKHFIISNRSIRPIVGTQTDTTTLGPSRLGSKVNEGMIPHSSEQQNLNLTTRCSLVSYPEQPEDTVYSKHYWQDMKKLT